MNQFKIKFHRPNKYTESITETAIVTIKEFKGYVSENNVSKKVVEALNPYAEIGRLNHYAAIAAFYNTNSNDFVIENIVPIA